MALALIVSAQVFAPSRPPPKADVFLLPPKDLKHFTFGYRENIADMMWIRVIQDFDYCENTKKRKLLTEAGPLVNAVCTKGWVYQMLDTITELAPKFRIPYIAGGLLLDAAVNDKEGAGAIYEKGLAEFPHDWGLQYHAAYYFLDVKKDPARAAALLVEAGKNGAPAWVISLAGRLYSKVGQALLAKSVLEEFLSKKLDERWERRIRERLEAVNKELEAAKANEANAPSPSSPPSPPPAPAN